MAILNPRAAGEKFDFRTVAPGPGLAPFVAHHWIVEWDLRGQPPYRQHVLPHPGVNVTFLAGRCRVTGVPRGQFSEELRDRGRVIGVRFRPGGFRPLVDGPVSALTDRFLPLPAVFGPGAGMWATAVLAAPTDGAVGLIEDFLVRRLPERPHPDAELAAAVVDRIVADPGCTRVDELAAGCGLGVRRLQRLFHEYVGVGPKWVIRRYRLHEAKARAEAGGLNLAELAGELGYTDQAHLTREFTEAVGTSPARYARAQGVHNGS